MNLLTPKLDNRIQSIDFLRGIAILGILLMNIESFAFPKASYQHFTDFTGINKAAWWWVWLLFEGTMRGLFSLLFGVSCMLILRKSDELKAVDIYYKRLLWLFAFGLINAYVFLWDGDILYGYAICGMFLFPFRNLKPYWLIALGLTLSLGLLGRSTFKYQTERKPNYLAYKAAMVDSLQNHKKLNIKQKEDIGKFIEMGKFLEKDTSSINSEIKTMHGNYSTIFKKKWVDAEQFQTWKIYDQAFWDEILMMFIGMGFFKLKVFSSQFGNKKYLTMMILGYVFGFSLKYYFMQSLYYDFDGFKEFFETYTIPTGALHDLARVFTTVGHMGLLMLIFNSNRVNKFTNIISKTGQMAFSNYLLQSIICAIFFYGFGFGMFAKLQIHQAYLFVGSVWTFNIVFSNIWLHYFKFGPFEWVWRSLTYWKRFPLKR